MSRSLAIPLLLFAAALGAQAAIDLPRLREVGPVPADVRTLTLRADGTMWDGTTTLTGEACAQAIQPHAMFVLAADRRARCGDVGKVLAAATLRGAAKVLFAATLPDGSTGAFALALPAVPRPYATLDMRLHRERDGVPPESVVPVLARMVRGSTVVAGTFVVGIEVAAEEEFEPLLQVLAATAAAGAEGALLRCASAAPAVAKGGPGVLADHLDAKVTAPGIAGSFAIDLGTAPVVRISARPRETREPRRREQPVGLLTPPADSANEERGGGAGGRYGGRGGARPGAGRAVGPAIARGIAWLSGHQSAFGGIAGDDGKPDAEATSLALLAVLGNGAVDAGAHDLLRSGLGLLLDQQRADGSFFEPGLGSVRRTALCTYVLAEGAGLLRQGALLRGSVTDALVWLGTQRQPDGGFSEGNPGASSDCSSTALCMMAFASADFFKLSGPAMAQELVTWYDLVAMADGAHRLSPTTPKDSPPDATATAAALFARYFAGQNPGRDPGAANVLLAHADIADPWCAYWTTYALFQTGGASWQAWGRKLDAGILATQVEDGEHSGSWPPASGLSRARVTALRVLALESYYRYSRLVR